MAYYAKLYTDLLADPKLMRAAREGATDLALLPWLIVFAKLQGDGGRLTVGGQAAEAADIAPMIPGVTAGQVGNCLDALVNVRILEADDDGVLRFAKWDKRAGVAPSSQPEAVKQRVADYRRRKKAVTTPVTTGVTSAVTKDVTTLAPPPVTRCNEGEIEIRDTATAPDGAVAGISAIDEVRMRGGPAAALAGPRRPASEILPVAPVRTFTGDDFRRAADA